MAELYESGAYRDANRTWHAEDSAWKAQHIENIIRKNDIPASTICEVGCGAGNILVSLSSAFPQSQLYGYEISPLSAIGGRRLSCLSGVAAGPVMPESRKRPFTA